MSVALGTGSSTFSAAVDKTGRIYVEGCVKSGQSYITKIGAFDVDLSVQVRKQQTGMAWCLNWPAWCVRAMACAARA